MNHLVRTVNGERSSMDWGRRYYRGDMVCVLPTRKDHHIFAGRNLMVESSNESGVVVTPYGANSINLLNHEVEPAYDG